MALGLLSEPVAVELLLKTAEIDATTANADQIAAAKTLCKGAGYLPLYVRSELHRLVCMGFGL